jgi:hypothetical protein
VDRLQLNATTRRLPLSQLASLEDLNFDFRTIRTALQKEGYSRHRARAKPLLPKEQKERRLQWALDHIAWSDRQWARVIWTDEASFCCRYFGQVYVTRKIGEEFNPDCLVARLRKYSACMIWGAIIALGPKELVVFEKGGVDGHVYRTQILPRLGRVEQVYSHESLFNQKPLVVQDNAPIHKAGLTMAIFEQSGIDLIPWPANSPDLNPIENIWAILKRRVSKHFPTTREAVIQAIQIEWSRLTASDCARACQSMRARCQAVIEAEGGHTKW